MPVTLMAANTKTDNSKLESVYQFRLTKAEMGLLEAVAEKLGKTKPEILRYLIRRLPDPTSIEMPEIRIPLTGSDKFL